MEIERMAEYVDKKPSQQDDRRQVKPEPQPEEEDKGEKSTSKPSVPEEPQYTAQELRAMELGWRPKDQYDGDPDDWVSAAEYLRRGELFGRINTYKHKITNLEKTVNALKEHSKMMFDAGYQQAKKELKAARKAALEEEDIRTVVEIDEKLEELEEEHQKRKQEFVQKIDNAAPTMHPAWESWLTRNPWYEENLRMRSFADGVAMELKQTNPNISFEKLLTEVEKEVKMQFSDKFENPNRNKQSHVEDASSGRSKGKSLPPDKLQEKDLPPEAREIMKTLVGSGVMTKEEYLEEYGKASKAWRM